MGFGALVSSLFALNSNEESKQVNDVEVKSALSVEEIDEPDKAGNVIDTRMHYAMCVSREVEKVVFKIVSAEKSFTAFEKKFICTQREYTQEEESKIISGNDFMAVAQMMADEAGGDVYLCIEDNGAGKCRVYAQFCKAGDEAVGQFSSDMPKNASEQLTAYSVGDITFGRIKRDK